MYPEFFFFLFCRRHSVVHEIKTKSARVGLDYIPNERCFYRCLGWSSPSIVRGVRSALMINCLIVCKLIIGKLWCGVIKSVMQFSLEVTILVRREGFKFSSRARMSVFSLFQIFSPRFLHFSSILFILLLGSLLTQSHTFSAILSALFHILISTFIPLYFSLTLRLIWDYSHFSQIAFRTSAPSDTLYHNHHHHQLANHNHYTIHYIYFKGHVMLSAEVEATESCKL